MKLQGGAIAVAHAGFLGTTYSYTSSEGVNVMVCSLFFATLPDKTKELVNLHNLEKTCTHKISGSQHPLLENLEKTFLMLDVITAEALSVSEHLEQNKKIHSVVTRYFVVVSRTYQFWLERKTITPVYPKKQQNTLKCSFHHLHCCHIINL